MNDLRLLMLVSAIVLAEADPDHCGLSVDSCPDSGKIKWNCQALVARILQSP